MRGMDQIWHREFKIFPSMTHKLSEYLNYSPVVYLEVSRTYVIYS